MDKSRGFLDFKRETPAYRPVEVRLQDSLEVYEPATTDQIVKQATRCMDCGVPFCQSGCPLGNRIPDWNDLVYRNQWQQAYDQLRSTNNFPEFTGRLCPAPCESACVLGIIDEPVTIERIEQEIIEQAFRNNWVQPSIPDQRTGKSVAVVGSGPAGLACAEQLNRAGHTVTVFERDDRVGGLLRYGIPDFKLEKWVIDRRVEVMEASGIQFVTSAHIGDNGDVSDLDAFDAIVLCIGSTTPRDLPIPGRDLDGVHFAWDYLWQQNKRVAGDTLPADQAQPIDAKDKHVIVIGGGDTGSDCVGTANRQGAISVTQFELLPVPDKVRPAHQPWPFYPMIMRTSSSHKEGANRHWSIMTKAFHGENGILKNLETVRVEMKKNAEGRVSFEEIPGTSKMWTADLVTLALGYVGPQKAGLLESLQLKLNPNGTIYSEDGYQTSNPRVFSAGDCRRGQSLIVWAISEGREAARAVDAYLEESTSLPTKGEGDLPFIR